MNGWNNLCPLPHGYYCMLQGFHHAALSTPGLDRLVAFYRSLCGGHPGIFDFSSPESRPGDPDGNIIELLEFGPSG